MIDISSLAKRMVEQSKNPQKKIQPHNSLHKSDFKFLYVIGKGGFGRVWKIQSKKTKTKYALKEMSKVRIIDKKSEKSINSEREFLSKLNHPFIVNMHYAFQDKDNLYLVMDLLNGGDLRFHISRYRKFSEEQTRFFIANMIYALEYIHENNVIHRDIKPENLVLEDKGYCRITDFGIAKENMPDNSSETSGTPGYMAPEVMKSRNHSFPVDFFAIGVIGYEFMTGTRPYVGKNRKEIKEQMLSKPAFIDEENIAKGWSQESADFINKLLERKESKRLGYKGGAKELMKHPWLKYYPWDELKSKTLLAPFIPDPKDNFDKNYCESIDKITEETRYRYEDILSDPQFKNYFFDFYFNKDEVMKERKEKEEKEKEEKEKKEKEEKEKKEKEEKEKKEKEEKEKKEKEEKEMLLIKNSSSEIDNKSKNDSNLYIQKYNINNIGGYNNNISNNYINKEREREREKEMLNKIRNQQDIIYHQINNSNTINCINNNSSNIIKNIRVNKINKNDNNSSSQNNINNIINSNSKLSSMNNTIKKEYDLKNNHFKKEATYKKPLSHSNSSKEIYSSHNFEKYLKIKQNPMIAHKKINKNQNIYRQQKSSLGSSNNSKFSRIPSSSKGNGTSININNYYTNNIFSAIYNNFIPNQNYEKKIEVNNKQKYIGQRSSSVFYQKRSASKSSLGKTKIGNENKIKNKNPYKK